jgi:hypothetical protein
MNIKINNISFRIENEGMLSREVYVKKENEEEGMEEFVDVEKNEEGFNNRRKSSVMS